MIDVTKKKRITFLTAIIIILAFFLLCISCNSPKYIAKRQARHCLLCPSHDTLKIVDKQILRDTTFFIKQDSAAWHFYLKCDSNNNVLIKELQEVKTAGIKTEIIYKNNVLYVKAEIDSAKFIAHVKEQLKSEQKTITKEVIKNIKTGIEWFQIWSARIFYLLLIIVIIYFLVKKFILKK